MQKCFSFNLEKLPTMQKIFFISFIISVLFPKLLFCSDFGNFSTSPSSGTIYLSPMEEFSGLKSSEILSKRINAVKSSPVFRNIENYRPSDSVFQLEDGLPWISAHEITCYGIRRSKDIGKGDSRESVGILNPELLFVFNMPAFAFHFDPDPKGCSSVDYLIPYRAYYNRITNTISAYIDHSSFYRKNRTLLSVNLEDANARDLGYNYVFADQTKNFRFFNTPNFSTEITQTSGYFHKGFSCQAATGCNNYSPYQSYYSIHIIDPDQSASLHIKLWKERPADPSDPADINYELILQ